MQQGHGQDGSEGAVGERGKRECVTKFEATHFHSYFLKRGLPW